MNESLIEDKISDACAFQHGTKVVRLKDVASAVQGLKEEIAYLWLTPVGTDGATTKEEIQNAIDKWFSCVVKK